MRLDLHSLSEVPLVSAGQLAELFSVDAATVRSWDLPLPICVNRRLHRWRGCDVAAWIESKTEKELQDA